MLVTAGGGRLIRRSITFGGQGDGGRVRGGCRGGARRESARVARNRCHIATIASCDQGMDGVPATARGRRRAQETESQARPGREEDKTSLVLMSTNPRERLPREAGQRSSLRWPTSNQRLRGRKLSRRTWILVDLCSWCQTLWFIPRNKQEKPHHTNSYNQRGDGLRLDC